MQASTTRRRALRALAGIGVAALAPAAVAADDDDDDAPGNSGGNRQDDDRGNDGRGSGEDDDRGNSEGHRQDDERGNSGGNRQDDDHGNGDDEDGGDGDGGSSADASVTRRDDGSAFTGGQTNQVDLDVVASEPVLVRDRVPETWSVVAGDDRDTYERDGERYVEFAAAVADGERTYLAEAPDDPAASGVHEFGPAEYSVDSETWTTVDGTDQTVVVGATT